MTNEEIIKELRDVIDCIANEEPITATRMALTIIKKLQPKPLFVVGPAKLRNGWDAGIYEVFDDCIHGYMAHGKRAIATWHKKGRYYKSGDDDFDLLPNNNKPDEKVYGPQKCNEPVKTCETCEHEDVEILCLNCTDRDKWEPIPTTRKLWKKAKDVEKAHRDAADSKLNFGDKE